MRDAFVRIGNRPRLGLIGMGLLMCVTLMVTACGGADEASAEGHDALAMAGADEFLVQDSMESGTQDRAPEGSNQGGVGG